MRRARAAAKQHNRVVQQGAALVLVLGQPREEMRQLLAEELIVLGELQLTRFVAGVRQAVVACA